MNITYFYCENPLERIVSKKYSRESECRQVVLDCLRFMSNLKEKTPNPKNVYTDKLLNFLIIVNIGLNTLIMPAVDIILPNIFLYLDGKSRVVEEAVFRANHVILQGIRLQLHGWG